MLHVRLCDVHAVVQFMGDLSGRKLRVVEMKGKRGRENRLEVGREVRVVRPSNDQGAAFRFCEGETARQHAKSVAQSEVRFNNKIFSRIRRDTG